MDNLKEAIRALVPIIYVKTHNDYGVFEWLRTFLKKQEERGCIRVFHPILGVHTLTEYGRCLQNLNPPKDGVDLSAHLTRMLRDDPKNGESFFVFFEGDEVLWDTEVQQTLRLLTLQREVQNHTMVKPVIFVGSSGDIPERLKPFVVVVDEMAMTPAAIELTVKKLNENFKGFIQEDPALQFTAETFAGARTAVEIDSAASWTLLQMKAAHREKKTLKAPAEYVAEFREKFRVGS